MVAVQQLRRWRERTRADEPGEVSQVSTISQALHLVTQGSPTGIAVVTRTGKVMLSNARAHDMSLVHDGTVNPRVWEVATEVFADQEQRVLDLELPQRTTGSRIRNVRAFITPLTLTENDYAVIYGSDESENVRMENARRDFVANVSHELKTPVGGMSLLAEALLQDPTDPETVEYFGGKLQKEALRMGDMITDLISLSKLQGAEALPDMAPARVDDVIADAVSRNLVTAENRDIEINVGAPSGIRVMADRSMLTVAVANLISNAINYSPNGQPVSVTQKVVREEVVLIRVTDRGIGIAPDDQKRVFERFYRVDKARSRSTGGTGLGLAIVKHVVANHGGSIKLWSRPGTGSTFTIELPIFDPESAREKMPDQVTEKVEEL
ncbi:cell wall metabolism sensor histidine kinase WalK [Corynebacterium sp. Marseille-P4321]|uniref:sensor histidine kinase n=1 Tax=Corynebacterium sp. Marseille-P4321 TaxID=2736603 RepID=UPI001F600754|nr:ATP-binding protein [Corynebacterium sp. Marseille-P4321]